MNRRDRQARPVHRTCSLWALGPGPHCPVPPHPPSHTWTGSSTLLLRKLRELARFILRRKERLDLPRAERGEGGGGKGSGGGWRRRLTRGEQIWWVAELAGDEGVHLGQELIWGWRATGWLLGRPIRVRGSPGVRRLLGATTLQLLHQHLTAAPQGISELPKGAAAPQGTTAVLRGGPVFLSATLTTPPPGPAQPPDSPRSTQLQALPPQSQTRAAPRHPLPHPGCPGGLHAHRCHPSAIPPPWSGLRGPGPEGGAGRISWSPES